MPASQACKYAVLPISTLGFEAKSTLHPLHGKASRLSGYVAASFDGSALALDPPPQLHVEFPVESLSSGNALQDREMWKLLDSKRNRSIYADLRELQPNGGDRYRAKGDITLCGRVRPYDGDLALSLTDRGVTIDGSLVVDIRDFGIVPPRILMITVQPRVTVSLHLVAALDSGAL